MLKRIMLAALVAAIVVLAGCGTHAVTKTVTEFVQPLPPVNAPLVKTAEQCQPNDLAMQCVLPRVTAFPQANTLTFSNSLYGVDFAWGGPRSCSQMQALGAHFGASYYSYDGSKDWNRGLVDAFHSCGVATVAVWETTADRALSGYAGGQSDGRAALAVARSVGEPDNRPIFFAVDFDTHGYGCAICPYFDGVASVIGRSRTGAYGGITTMQTLFDTGRITYGWQAYAWSYGAWDTRAKLEQYLNGSDIDHDRAIGDDYGQWPFNAGLNVGQLIGARDASLHAYGRAHCATPVLGSAACGLFGWRVQHFDYLLDQKIGARPPTCFGPRAHVHAAACVIARQAVATWLRAVASTQRVEDNLACFARGGQGETRQACFDLHGRETYFTGQIAQNKAFYR